MASVTLYRFKIELSDLDRGMYESLDFRVAMHPSETTDFLLTRVLAYALSYEEGLEFSPGGLSDVEEPAIKLPGKHGTVALAIEIGNPSGRRIHKNAKAADRFKVYTYKDPNSFLREISSFGAVHKAAEIEAYAIDPKFLDRVSNYLERENKWSLLVQDGALTLGFGASSSDHSETTELKRMSLVT